MSHFTYLVLSHRDPHQVERLVRAIRHLSPDARVVVTHDAHDSDLPRALDDHVEVHRRRHGTAWGRFDLVEAVLDRLVDLEQRDDHDWVVVISGQDFPVRPLVEWEAEVRASGADALIHAAPIETTLRWGRNRNSASRVLTRYVHRQLYLPAPARPRGWWRRKARWGVQVLLSHAAPLASYHPLPNGGSALGVRRRTPFGPAFPCRKGSQWLALDRAAVHHLLEVDRSSDLRAFYARTLIPDESYIQTIVLNAPHLRTGTQWVTADLFEPLGNPHPVVATEESLPRLLARAGEHGAAFVRKVDPAHPEAIAELERRLGISAQ